MAVVTTSLTPGQRYFPFTGFTPQSDRTSDARAEVVAFISGGSITLSGVGDTQRLLVTIDMPLNFAYVITDFLMELVSTAGDVFGFAADGQALLLTSTSGAIVTIPLGVVSDGVAENAVTVDSRSYHLAGKWSGVMIPDTSSDQIRLQVVMANPTTNQGAYTIQLAARFLQYDIMQAHDLRVNTPIPVR